jgi:type I restriction enzyme R subunit
LFQKFFENSGKIRTAIIISDEHEDGNEKDIHKKEVVEYLNNIRENNGNVAKYEKDVIESFKYNEDGIEIIIVVDKLLTGFDAPRNTVLYLAKDLRDHNLLQAIARVNRLHENKKLPKTAGYIIDYSENAKNIDTAMKLFGKYDEEDVKGTLIDVNEKIEELEQSYSLVNDIFKEVKSSSDDEVYLQFLGDNPKRDSFYKALNNFIKNLNECFALQEFVHEFDHLDVYKKELKKFMELRRAASLKYADRIDLAQYKQSLVNVLDKYVDAQGVELLTKQVNITDRKQFEEAIENLGSDKSKAEAIAAQTQKTVTEKMDMDPEFYERFSRKISEILEEMRIGKLADIEALKQLKLIRDDVVDKKDETLPEKISFQKGADIFYRNLQESFEKHIDDEQAYIDIVLDILNIIKSEAIVDWYKNSDVKRKIMNAIDDYLYDVVRGQKNINLSDDEMKTIISTAMQLAENNNEVIA